MSGERLLHGAVHKSIESATTPATTNPASFWEMSGMAGADKNSKVKSGVHRVEEILIALGLVQLIEQEFDRVHCSHRIENAP